MVFYHSNRKLTNTPVPLQERPVLLSAEMPLQPTITFLITVIIKSQKVRFCRVGLCLVA